MENLEKLKTFSSQGILNRLEKSGNFVRNTGENERISSFILQKWRHFSQLFCSYFLIEAYLLNSFLYF